MPDRSWFFAANGQQQGPFPEAQFRDLVARGNISTQTLVWTEGMAGWQKAGDIPGLMSVAAGPPSIPQMGGPLVSTGGNGASLSLDLPILDFVWRGIALAVGLLLVIPGPWVLVWYLQWFTSC